MNALWLELLVALGAGNLTIGPIHCDDAQHYVDGAMLTGRAQRGHIRLNPAHELVDTALHELLHRIRPTWTERRVRKETAALMRDLTDTDIDRLDGLVRSVAAVRKRPIRVDLDD